MMNRAKLMKCAGTVLATMLACMGSAQAASALAVPLAAKVELVSAKAAGAAPQALFTLTNNNDYPVWVLAWELPGSQLSNDQFRVTRDGAAVAYQGRLVKHVAPTAGDYIQINAKSSYSVQVDVAKYYSLEQAGDFAINFKANQLSVLTQAPAARGVVRATLRAGVNLADNRRFAFGGAPNTLLHRASVAEPSGKVTVLSTKLGKVTTKFVSCSASQQSALTTALTNATAYNAKAVTWINANTQGGGLYTTWFGKYTAARYAKVKAHYAGIATEFASKTITFECNNADGNMAYVYPDDAYHIYLGSGYWPAAAKGYDSKAGTLIHESSHFTVNGGTDDYVYGLDEGKALAISTPDQAVQNADNVEHFAESL